MTIVGITFIDEPQGVLGIAFIDAEPGTPVLDIKPYYGMDRVKEYQVPQWYEDAGIFDWAGEFENAH